MAGESDLRRAFFFLATLALVGGILYWARPVMVPLTLAVLTTFVLAPIVGRLEHVGVPRMIACPVVLFGAAALLIGIAEAFVQQMGPLSAEIPAYKAEVTEKIRAVRKATANSWLIRVIDFADELGKGPAAPKTGHEQSETIATKIEIPVIAIMQSVAGTAAGILFDLVLVMMLALLMLMRREDLRNRLIQLLGSANRISATRALDDASKRVSRFLAMQLLVNLGFGAVVALGLYFIGIPHPYTWGTLAALLRYVPYLGGWIAAAFPLLASMILPTWTPFMLTAVFFVVLELVQANLVEPLAFGHSIGVSGTGQVIAMLFWATLWGPVGLILSTPLTACLCVLGHHFPGLRFFATLMGNGEGVDKPDAFYQRLLAGDPVEASNLAEEFLKQNSATALVDDMLITALVSARLDNKAGDLALEDRVTITEAVREIFYDLPPVEIKEPAAAPAVENATPTNILAVEFPFNDEVDHLVMDMLKAITSSDRVVWSVVDVGAGALEEIVERIAPRLILVLTTERKNLARIRGACKMIHKLVPDTEVLVCCWGQESEANVNSLRLHDSGATVICTTAFQARQLIVTAANVECEPEPAAS